MQDILDCQDAVGKTPLHHASENGQLTTVKKLVSNGANITILDNDGRTAFDLGKNHIEVASYLGHRMSDKFLEEDKYEDAVKILDELLIIQEEALGNDHSETTETRDSIGSLNSLLYLIGRSDTKPPSFLKYLETQNEADGRTPLHAAAETGQLDTVKSFVSFGVNMNIRDHDGKTAFDLGKEHVEVATYLGNRMSARFLEEVKYEDALKIYEELLPIQVEFWGCDHSETCDTRDNIERLQSLMYFLGLSSTKPSSFVKYMEEQDDAGRTPLHKAAENGRLLFVKHFVRSGLNIYILDHDGKTAFDLGKHHFDVASYLGQIMSEQFLADEKYEDALKILGELLIIQEDTLGSSHSETAKTRNYIGSLNDLLYAMGRCDLTLDI